MLEDILKGVGGFIKEHPIISCVVGVKIIEAASKNNDKKVDKKTEAETTTVAPKTTYDTNDLLLLAGCGFFVYQLFKIV